MYIHIFSQVEFDCMFHIVHVIFQTKALFTELVLPLEQKLEKDFRKAQVGHCYFYEAVMQGKKNRNNSKLQM